VNGETAYDAAVLVLAEFVAALDQANVWTVTRACEKRTVFASERS
jgi:hypothetical protein